MPTDTAVTTLIHLLGAADLGLERGRLREELSSLATHDTTRHDAALTGTGAASQDPEGRTDHLPQHAAFRPLASALYELAAAGTEQVATLVLVATAQPDAHPDDTADLAALLQGRLQATAGDLYGIIPIDTVLVATAAAPTLEAVQEAVALTLRADQPQAGTAAVALAGGATGAFLGVLLGTLEAGRFPAIVEANRQDGAGDDDRVHPLIIDHDTRSWAAASGNIAVLEALTAGSEQVTADALFAVHQLDWARLERSDLRETEPWAHLTGGQRPNSMESWRHRRTAVEAAITWRLARGDRSALNLLRPWIEVEYGYRRTTALRQHEVTDDLHFEARHYFQQSHLARTAPEPVRSFVTSDVVQWLWDRGSRADHGGQPDPDLRGTTLRWAATAQEENHYLDIQAAVGRVPAMPPSDGVMVVEPVGQRDLQDGSTPMLDAVLSAHDSQQLHLRLVASADTQHIGEALAAKAVQRKVDVRLLLVSDPYAYTAVRDDLVEELDADPGWRHTDHAVLITGPGTKAMNTGCLAATLTTAYNHARPLQIASIQRQDDHSSRLLVSPQRVSARLAHDTAVEHAAGTLLDHLDLTGLEQLLSHGSKRWAELQQQVHHYRRLLLGNDVTGKDLAAHNLPPSDDAELRIHLWQARTMCLRELVGIDTWRAIYLVAAVAEQTDPDRTWRHHTRPAGAAVWQLRNDSPYGHRTWTLPPARADARALIYDLLAELPEGLERRSLLDIRDRIAADIARISTGPET